MFISSHFVARSSELRRRKIFDADSLLDQREPDLGFNFVRTPRRVARRGGGFERAALQRHAAGGVMNRRHACVCVLALIASRPAWPRTTGIPPAYQPLVVEPQLGPGRSEFDLGPALARAKRENKRLYVYLGAEDCPYCRRYEAFLARNAGELVPTSNPDRVDLRSSRPPRRPSCSSAWAAARWSTPTPEFDHRRARRMLSTQRVPVDAQLKPLMPMPAGTGTSRQSKSSWRS